MPVGGRGERGGRGKRGGRGERGARDPRAYWRTNLRILGLLISIWAVAGFGLGIVAVPWLDRFQLGGFPLGFWFSQQGSIVVFVVLILVYALWMDRIERGPRRDRTGDD